MSPVTTSLLFLGAIALGTGCTFEPPGSVLNNGGGGGGGADAGTGGGGGDAAVPTETMTITFGTEDVAGDYEGKNIVATWIEDAQGAFVKTIDRKSAVRTVSLRAWGAKAPANDQDAVSGATRLNHGTPVTATWTFPTTMADGIYTIRIETADSNAASPAENTQGTYTFEKNGTALKQENVAGAGYLNVSIDYSGAPL